MTEEKHLLTILMEECAEVTKSSAKAIRFGLETGENSETNKEEIIKEFNDLVAVMEMIFDDVIDRELIEKKKIKVRNYMNISKKLGEL